MKILYIAKQFPLGATEAFVFPEVKSHVNAGWDVWFAPLSRGKFVHDDAAQFVNKLLEPRLFSFRILLGAIREFLAQPRRSMAIFATIFESRTLPILARNIAVIPKAFWLAGQIRRRNFQHVHIHWAAAPATMGAFAATLANVPFSITAHRYDIKQRNLLPWKARHAAFIRAIDKAGASEISAEIGPDDPRPLILYMGVEIPKTPAARRPGALSPLRVIAAARLVKKKGLHTLIEAAFLSRKAGCEVEIDIFGDGPLKQDLAQRIHNAQLEKHVRLKGNLPHNQLLTYLYSGIYDIAALPSITTEGGDKEGIPVFLIEAMAAGVPVITTSNGGIPELAGNNCGVIVNEKDSHAIAAAFSALANNDVERERLALVSREKVAAEFEIEKNVTRLRNLILKSAEKGLVR